MPKDQILQFSKAPIQDTFGDLPFGEIPEPLKYVRPFSKFKIHNLQADSAMPKNFV